MTHFILIQVHQITLIIFSILKQKILPVIKAYHPIPFSYTLQIPPTVLSPTNTIADSFPIFRWIDNISNFQYTSEFVIRMEKSNEDSSEPFWVSRFYNQWFGYENTIPISFLFFPAMGSWGETNVELHANATI